VTGGLKFHNLLRILAFFYDINFSVKMHRSHLRRLRDRQQYFSTTEALPLVSGEEF
jgi:hypothetical protein